MSGFLLGVPGDSFGFGVFCGVLTLTALVVFGGLLIERMIDDDT